MTREKGILGESSCIQFRTWSHKLIYMDEKERTLIRSIPKSLGQNVKFFSILLKFS